MVKKQLGKLRLKNRLGTEVANKQLFKYMLFKSNAGSQFPACVTREETVKQLLIGRKRTILPISRP